MSASPGPIGIAIGMTFIFRNERLWEIENFKGVGLDICHWCFLRYVCFSSRPLCFEVEASCRNGSNTDLSRLRKVLFC